MDKLITRFQTEALDDQALFGSPTERSAVRAGRTEVGVPGVEVSVEVQHGDRPVVAVQ